MTDKNDSGYIAVFITTASQEEAETIAYTLVNEKIVACVNIISPIKSIYTWQGKLEKATECLLIAKTTTSLFQTLKKRVKELHSYEVPEIISLDLMAGEEGYLRWISEVTLPSPNS
jgi:periplasmic divalent cation tolerance protein